MPFDGDLFRQAVLRALARRFGPSALPAWARPPVFLAGLCSWVLLNLFHRLCWALDEVLFPDLGEVEIERPLFVVGVARSGTTFLHRFLASDRESFTSIRTWEILFAPSILQKKALMLVGRLDDLLGAPATRLYKWLKARYPGPMAGIHDIDLFEPEEDEYLFSWCFASMFIAEVLPYHDLVSRYVRFDEEIEAGARRRLMDFHRGFVRRHLYVAGPGRRYLGKSPSYCGKLESLDAAFPGARLAVLVRSPLETVPSYLSLLGAMRQGSADESDDLAAQQEEILAVLDHFLVKPVGLAETLFKGRCRLATYPELMGSFDRVVEDLYRDQGRPLPPGFRVRLEAEAAKSRRYRSEHRYALEQFGLDRAAVVARYQATFERFGFPTGG